MRSVARGRLMVGWLAGVIAAGSCAPVGPSARAPAGERTGVDPTTCGRYAASDVGRRIRQFLEATVRLNREVHDSEAKVRMACTWIGGALGAPPGLDARAACQAAAKAIRDHLTPAMKGPPALRIAYAAPVCTVNADDAATAAARCEGTARAEVKARCAGACAGTCDGTCDGACAGGAAGGACHGACRGTCRGECTGECQGAADVDASAECEASAEVEANLDASCSEPALTIMVDPALVSAARVDPVVRALRLGLPHLIVAAARVGGPVRHAAATWARSARALAGSIDGLAGSLGDQTSCVAGQIAAAAALVAGIQVSIDIQVQASESIEGAARGT